MRQAHGVVRGVLALALSGLPFAGCDSGGGGGATAAPATSTAPLLVSVTPAQGAPGDIVTVSGFNFPPEVARNLVLFRSALGPGEIPGAVIEVVFSGAEDERLGTESALRVVVPTGVPSGACTLIADTGEELVAAGAAPFTGCPQVVGVAIGPDGRRGFEYFAPALGALTASIEIYGYNLESITGASIVDPVTDEPVECPSVTDFAPEGDDAWILPAGMTAVSIEVPESLTPSDEACTLAVFPYRLLVAATMPDGTRLDLPPIEIQFRVPLLNEYVPPAVTAMQLPSGVRSGDVAITYAIFQEPAYSRWDLFPEFLHPASGEWVRCAPKSDVTGANGDRAVTGGETSTPGVAALVGPGELTTFLWDTRDTAGGLPAGRNVTRIRLVPDSPEDAAWAPLLLECPAAVWESPPIVIDNSAPLLGNISESFGSTLRFDTEASFGVTWDTATGTLSGGSDGSPLFGTGLEDIVLRTGNSYTFDTDSGSARHEGATPEDLFAGGNPGAASDPPEFWVRTIVAESGATIEVVGRNPLVIRASGTGGSTDVVARIETSFDLRGEPGSRPVATDDPPLGRGGRGGPGGSDGGDGGRVMADGTNTPGLITGEIWPQAADGPSGGCPGRNMSQLRVSLGVNNPKPGPGGGGGHADAGGNGTISLSQATTPQSAPGRGGAIRGDAQMTRLTGGGGGGGGAGMAFRGGVAAVLKGRRGGGGGGGGGAFQLTVDGSIVIGGNVICDGGIGEVGETGGPPSPGGGGAGGGILLQAPRDITLENGSLLRAMGARGGFVGASANPQLAGGIGAPGRIRLEANGMIVAPGAANFSGIQGPESALLITLLVDPIDGGTGADGTLDLTGESGIFDIDTDSGEIFAPGESTPLLTSGSGNGELHFEKLVVPEGVTLRARGDGPFVVRVSATAEIRGTIDASGEDGGQVNLYASPPLAGEGGLPGAGGGPGGTGGIATGDEVIDGARGGYPPPLPDEHRAEGGDEYRNEPDPPPADLPGGSFVVLPAVGGESLNSGCGAACRPGHGGGGGYALDGSDGATPSDANAASGQGGRAFGSDGLVNPQTGAPLPVGGTGGAGGGASYRSGVTVPGSGGGGAGGYFQLSVSGTVVFGATARILAAGGRASQAPVAGGSGGGGAGGAILLEGDGTMIFETGSDGSGPFVSALGGVANLAPTADFDPVPGADYSGNGPGLGGNGAPGRILIRSRIPFNTEPPTTASPIYLEYPLAANAPSSGVFPPPSVGTLAQAGSVFTWATTLPYRVAQEDGSLNRDARFSLADLSVTPLGDPPEVAVRVRFEGAEESLDVPGTPGAFHGLVEDPSHLDGADYLRMTIFFYTPVTGSPVPVLDEIVLPIDFFPTR